jgi:hypothetical protein
MSTTAPTAPAGPAHDHHRGGDATFAATDSVWAPWYIADAEQAAGRALKRHPGR